MNASEAVSRIQRKLGYRTDKADEILEELNDAQLTLEMGVPSPYGKGTFTPWFLISEVASAATEAGEERIAIPTDFRGEIEGFQLYYFNEDAEDDENAWVRLTKLDEAQARAYSPPPTDTDLLPAGYWYSGGYWRIVPTPNAERLLKIIYSGADTVLTTTPDITNRWLTYAPWVLIGAAGVSMAGSLRDATAQQFFQARMAADISALWNQTEMRFNSNARPVMGGAV